MKYTIGITTFFGTFILGIALLFKTMHWNGGGIFLQYGILLMALHALFSLVFFASSKDAQINPVNKLFALIPLILLGGYFLAESIIPEKLNDGWVTLNARDDFSTAQTMANSKAVYEVLALNGENEKAALLAQKSAEFYAYLDGFSQKVIELSGGVSDGKTLGADDYTHQMYWTLGPEGSASGEGYALEEKAKAFEAFIIKEFPSVYASEDKISLAIKPADMARPSDMDVNYMRLPQLYFDHIRTVGALNSISQLKERAAGIELKAAVSLLQ